MPPKKKTKASKAKVKAKVDKEEQTQDTEKNDPAPAIGKRRRSKEQTPDEIATPAAEKKEKSAISLDDRKKKLEELKRRRTTEVEQGNRRDRNLEFQRSKENPRLDSRLQRKRAEALAQLEKQEALDKGEDVERKMFWKYSAESVDAWNEREEKKKERANVGFTDYSQAANKKYKKQMAEHKPDMAAYREKKLEAIERAILNGDDPSDVLSHINDLGYASLDDKPSKEGIDRLVQDVKKQQRDRETRSRDRKEATDDISWINERNRVFNQKIARFYDKYTKEIRDNLERGTAL